MAEQKRGDDAQDHAPQPHTPPREAAVPRQGSRKPPAEQDAANYQRERSDADALPREDLNSANDE